MAGGIQQGGGRGRRRAMNSEINVTPFVDVMLVLLIVFMITAPLLATGIEITLPKTKADALPATQEQVLTVSVDAEGRIFVQEEEIPLEELITKLEAIARTGYEERIHFRGDAGMDWGVGIAVLNRMERAGFSNVAVVTDPAARGEDE